MEIKSSLSAIAVWLATIVYPAVAAHAQVSADGNGAAAEALAVIVHQSNPVESLTREELRRILLFEHTQWPHGRRHSVALLPPGSPERAAVLRLVCRFSEKDYERHLLQLAYTGNLQAHPKELANPTNLRKFIFNVPGAIGCVRADAVDDTVKVVRIDGHRPGDPDYPLKLPVK